MKPPADPVTRAPVTRAPVTRAPVTRATVRPARADDVETITGIYAHHVRHGVASFEETPPESHEMGRRMAAIGDRGLPFLVAEIGGGTGGEIAGFAYAAPYRDRSAYRWAVEDSIYLADGFERRGIGTLLLGEIIERCTETGMRQMIAIIGDSANAASIAIHARHGFRLAGTLPSVGFKFGRWIDSVIMARPLGAGDSSPPDRPSGAA